MQRNDNWEIYDMLLDGVPAAIPADSIIQGDIWTLAKLGDSCGIAMTTTGETVPAMFKTGNSAAGIKSFHFMEASRAMACINAFYNTECHMMELQCEEPYDHYCTYGLDLKGKTIGVIGHLKMPEHILTDAKKVYILERSPQPGDYPDTACEFLLPECDIALITGAALINKTLPRLLELCKNAYTILTGPTVPMCPKLLQAGIDRLAGMVITDPAGIEEYVRSDVYGPPYRYGTCFLLKKDDL